MSCYLGPVAKRMMYRRRWRLLSGKSRATEGVAKPRAGQDAYEEVAKACSSPSGAAGGDHEKLRNALATLRSAMNWLEDPEYFEAVHGILDKAGMLARTEFPEGCRLHYEEETYFIECPVALA